jgi:hypothetical protein
MTRAPSVIILALVATGFGCGSRTVALSDAGVDGPLGDAPSTADSPSSSEPSRRPESGGSGDLLHPDASCSSNKAWAVAAGGINVDKVNSIAVGKDCSSYITGQFGAYSGISTATFGKITLTSNGLTDLYVAKLDGSGEFLWAVAAGGKSYDWGLGIAVDGSGHSYITGMVTGISYFGALTLAASTPETPFVAKLDPQGNFLWATLVDAAGTVHGIAVDSAGQSYITGSFKGSASFGSTLLTSAGDLDIFVAKVDKSGSFAWARSAGGPKEDVSEGIATDSSGAVYLTGHIQGGPVSFGSLTINMAQNWMCVFAAKIDTQGNFLWATSGKGGGVETAHAIAVDGAGNSSITGQYWGGSIMGTTTLPSIGGIDIFVAKLDKNGNFVWAKAAGGKSNDSGLGIGMDGAGNSYVTGTYVGSATFGTTSLAAKGGKEAFVTKLDPDGKFLFAKSAGGVSDDQSSGLAADSVGNCYAAGFFHGEASIGPASLKAQSGYEDLFVWRLPATVP